jgi:predicted small secreted protein
MFKQILTVLILATLLTACATNGRGINEVIESKPVIIDTGCKWIQPIYVSKKDVLTDGTARQILAHDEIWAKNCEQPKQ